MRGILISIVKLYQRFLSPWMGNQCRFYPSCSHYAVEALRVHGSVLGGALVLGRLLRCQPWCSGGVDHVPAQWSARWMCRCHVPHQE